MVSLLNKIGNKKNRCEDSYLFKENDNFIWGGVFDGCSSGINSAWASQTLAYIYDKVDINVFLYETILEDFWKSLETSVRMFGITEEHFLSTAILFKYDKLNHVLSVRPLGDGVIFVNGVKKVYDQKNLPDYLAYHIGNPYQLNTFYNRYPVEYYDEVTSFHICSDGIDSFALPQSKEKIQEPIDFLTSCNLSENHLVRKFNILQKQGWLIHDDLTILSYEESIK
jgi:hypothetical protein